jgi:hypothetical protein
LKYVKENERMVKKGNYHTDPAFVSIISRYCGGVLKTKGAYFVSKAGEVI